MANERLRSRKMNRLALVALLWSVPSFASVWGVEGHAVVAELADMHLTTVAKARVAQLLPPGESLASISSWADEVCHKLPATAPWHFVDIPGNQQYLASRDYPVTPSSPQGSCVIGAIRHFQQVLADPQQAAQHAEALKWLVHFVGDIHQPLHCDDHNDRGGNQVTVKFFKQTTNLHAVWDTGIIGKTGLTEIDYARQLNARLRPADIPGVEAGTLENWASESHVLADQHSYQGVTANGRLAGTYFDANEPIVDQQLTRGGIRLAKILNDLLK